MCLLAPPRGQQRTALPEEQRVPWAQHALGSGTVGGSTGLGGAGTQRWVESSGGRGRGRLWMLLRCPEP